MTTFNISMDDELAEFVDQMMKRFKFSNRSEFFRDLVRQKYIEETGVIEQIYPGDPDYELIQREKLKNDEFIDLEEVLKANNIKLNELQN